TRAATARIERARLVPRLEEDVVKHVLGGGAIPEHAQSERQQQAAVPIVERAQRTLVAARDGRDQRGIVEAVDALVRATDLDLPTAAPHIPLHGRATVAPASASARPAYGACMFSNESNAAGSSVSMMTPTCWYVRRQLPDHESQLGARSP